MHIRCLHHIRLFARLLFHSLERTTFTLLCYVRLSSPVPASIGPYDPVQFNPVVDRNWSNANNVFIPVQQRHSGKYSQRLGRKSIFQSSHRNIPMFLK